MAASGNTITDSFVGAVAGFTTTLERLFIVQPIEGARRLQCRLDPRLYSESFRIRRIREGKQAKKGDRFVLFVLYARSSVPAFIETVLRSIGRSRLNLVISTNAHITDALREELLEKCHLLIERADLGRDFGGYKDGISIIEKRYGTPERLILLNDSLFFFEKGLDQLIADLDGEEEVIGITEDFHQYYHIQSFALSFGPTVLRHKRVRRYWRQYRPISTRLWAVNHGERRLTLCLMRAGFRPKILYHAARLVPHLRTRRLLDLMEAVYFLPQATRGRLYRELDELRDSQTLPALAALDTVSRSVRRLSKAGGDELAALRESNMSQVLRVTYQIASVHRTREEWAVETFGERIGVLIANHNQVHMAGFLFMKYLGLPVMKRDLFFREVYALEEIDNILTMLGEPMKDEVMSELRQKGAAFLLRGIRRILYRHGAL